MHIEASCHCGAVRFSCEAYAPAPYLRCHCSICRKLGGGGGYAINLGARAESLRVEGEEHLSSYVVKGNTAERKFCRHCGSMLWAFDPTWPDLIHPFASAVDSDLPEPPEAVHMMLGSKANWVRVDARDGETVFEEYPDQSLEDWHRAHGFLG
ncbi:MAG: GFA family protein [Rhodospirillaceae bacterium]|jgi:hypothetical protein|nr:GFA family protein [Rhodospirillaceae bacterium]MBT6139187.1 GFA family protein [Rhodospirillaceae bacterium]